jgi:ArsR family metal-binding transcriptional regulator
MELSTFYQLMPQKDCGICGYGSCNTFARHVVFGKEDPAHCVWLENTIPIQDAVCQVKPVRTRVEENAVFQPCITDATMVMAEFYLATKEVEYGYVDPGFCEYVLLYFDEAKCSQSLGIGRIEWEGKELLISQTGKILIRQAVDNEDAVEACQLLSRLVSGAVICSNLATALECVSGPPTLRDCEVQSPSHEEKESTTVINYEDALVQGFSCLQKGNPVEPATDMTSLKMKAVHLLARKKGGLTLFALAHHFQHMQEALNEAAGYRAEREPQHETLDFLREVCKGSYRPEQYPNVCWSPESKNDPFSRELYKAVFHAGCIHKIKVLHLN